MSTILILGIVTFVLSSIYFTIKPKQGFNSAFLVSFVTLISYIVMLQGRFSVNDIYWTRWLVYGISCPLLAFEISKRVGLDLDNKIFNVFLTAIVMVTGALASTSAGDYKIAFFALSCIAFAKLMWSFFQTKSEALKTLTPYIIGWCVFPLVFIFTNEGTYNLISVQNAAAIYLILDIITKIVFYIHHSNVKQIA
jgi:bacteriorhodopsin